MEQLCRQTECWTVNFFNTRARPRTAVIIFPMLAGSLFRVCNWSTTQLLVFHFVRARPSVPCSAYLTCWLVNKQPGWFPVPFILPRFSLQQGAVKRNKMDLWICASGSLVRFKLLQRKLLGIMNKLLIQLLWQAHWLSEGTTHVNEVWTELHCAFTTPERPHRRVLSMYCCFLCGFTRCK